MTTPGSPSRRTTGKAVAQRDRILDDLSARWGLVIQPPKDGESPSRRLEKLTISRKAETYPEECFFKINFLCLKDETALLTALNTFHHAASALKTGWVYKPDADDDLLPRPPRSNPDVTGTQREQLFQCLLRFVTPAFELAKERQVKNVLTMTKSKDLHGISQSAFKPHVVERHISGQQLDDTPIPFCLDDKGRGKRRSERDEERHDDSKRTKGLEGESASQKVIDMVDSVPVVTRQFGSDDWPSADQLLTLAESTSSFTAAAFKVPDIPSNLATNDTIQQRPRKQPETANTSFTSNASVFSSVFDDNVSDVSDESYFSTQTSVMDTSSDQRGIQEREHPVETEYTQYGSSIEDFQMTDSPSLNPEDVVREGLRNVFPAQPAFLQDAPLAIRYEITRVCCYAKVAVSDLNFPMTDFSNLRGYDGLWNFLKAQPALRGKDFPEKSDRDAWLSSLDKFHKNFHGVVLSGRLKFNTDQGEPFFTFQLQPLKTEISHRLSRRFGNDRFLEISIPSFSGHKLPKLLKDAQRSGHGEACRQVIVEWMTQEQHSLLGMTWGSFYLKDCTKKRPKLKLSIDEEVDSHANNTVYLFATGGAGFQVGKTIPPKGEPFNRHTTMTVSTMVKWLVPLEQNKHQNCLKLFSRIALGLSKTWKTVELDPSEIRYPPDLMSEDNREVMNDGCGRLSMRLAINVVQCLGLTYVPSGFQARIGGAKGFWIIDVNDDSGTQWIEIYPSQIKWDRSPEVTDLTDYESDHRTFEVVSWVKPLKSAALNLQLIPILEDCGSDRTSMRAAISRLLENGLRHEIQVQREAMERPQAFRKWVRDNNSGISDRIKHGHVRYLAGIPCSLEEQLNLLLDAGFDPQRLQFLKDLAWKTYTQKCEVLKSKLNIAVGLSTYAYMVVDFTGTLEPDEVHVHFSNNFTDEVSGFSETLLDGMDILVARCPAHYVSDIQKVKAVWRRELKPMKDVIVFSSKGNFPLAKKLSGGDYDGDMAWICFEPAIVSEFGNADIPDCPNLVELGHIHKDKTKYSDMLIENRDPVPGLLQYCFEFNLRDNLLGICTNHKEFVCYANNNVRNREAIFLSTLLSDLVDQRKQGYSFTMESWEKFKSDVIKTKVREPNYKRDRFDGRGQPEHIIDYLKFTVAEKTIEQTLTAFHQSLASASDWDDDLVKLAKWAREQAKKSPEWKSLIGTLEHDVKSVKEAWNKHFSRRGDPETMANFSSIVTSLHDEWQAIVPPEGNLLSQTLSPSCLPSLELSTFALLKASLGFSLGSRQYVSRFIWWMAGKQLAALKAIYGNDGGGGTAVITPQMYAMLRPDSTFVKLMRSQDHDPRFWEAKAESVVPDEEMGNWEWDEDMGG